MAWPATSARSKNWGTEVLTDTDLEGEFDILHSYINDALNSSSGHKHDGTTAEGPKLNLASSLTIASQATGDVFYASNASTIARLGIGTANQVLQTNSGATAPEWASFSSFVTASNALSGSVVQHIHNQIQTPLSGSTVFVYDDTSPTSSEGNAIAALDTAITPNHASNKINIRVTGSMGATTGIKMLALYKDGTCIACNWGNFNSTDGGNVSINYEESAGDTSERTYTVRYGSMAAGTIYLNSGLFGTSSDYLNDTTCTSITVQEIKA